MLWVTPVIAAVPVFLMCSGALFLSAQKELSIKKLFGKYLLRILVALFVWGMFYKIYHLLFTHTLSAGTIIQSIKETVLFDNEAHLYYLHIVLLLYAFFPILRVLTSRGTKQELQYALGFWFALGIIYPSLITFWPFTLFKGVPLQWTINMTYASIGYALLGHYIKRYTMSTKASWWLFATGSLVIFATTFFLSLRHGALVTTFLQGMSVGSALFAAGVFGIAVNYQSCIKGRVARVIVYLSKASFCIYLVHEVVRYELSHRALNYAMGPALYSVPLVTVPTLLLSLAVYALLSHIPVVKKWLV